MSDFNDLTRIGSNDQDNAAVQDMARRVATYAKTLRSEGVDESTYIELVTHLQTMLWQDHLGGFVLGVTDSTEDNDELR